MLFHSQSAGRPSTLSTAFEFIIGPARRTEVARTSSVRIVMRRLSTAQQVSRRLKDTILPEPVSVSSHRGPDRSERDPSAANASNLRARRPTIRPRAADRGSFPIKVRLLGTLAAVSEYGPLTGRPHPFMSKRHFPRIFRRSGCFRPSDRLAGPGSHGVGPAIVARHLSNRRSTLGSPMRRRRKAPAQLPCLATS